MKQCWFRHNFTEVAGFTLAHIGGKITRAPLTRTIVVVLKCTDCDQGKEVYFKEAFSSQAQQEVNNLNQALGKELDPNIYIPSEPLDYI